MGLLKEKKEGEREEKLLVGERVSVDGWGGAGDAKGEQTRLDSTRLYYLLDSTRKWKLVAKEYLLPPLA